MIKEGDKVYLVKYALSGAIEQCEVREHNEYTTGHVRLVGRSYDIYKIGSDVFADRADAISAAEAMRTKKIASIKKQIAKLEKRDFAAELAKAEGL